VAEYGLVLRRKTEACAVSLAYTGPEGARGGALMWGWIALVAWVVLGVVVVVAYAHAERWYYRWLRK